MFEVGDLVTCKERKDLLHTDHMGAGYRPGRVFRIRRITHSIYGDILWTKKDCRGVYADSVYPKSSVRWLLSEEEYSRILKLNENV